MKRKRREKQWSVVAAAAAGISSCGSAETAAAGRSDRQTHCGNSF